MDHKETFDEFVERMDEGAAAHEGRNPVADLYEVQQKNEEAVELVAKEVSYIQSLSEFIATTRQALDLERGKHEELKSEEMIDLLNKLLADLEVQRTEAKQRMERASAESEELNRKLEELKKKVPRAA